MLLHEECFFGATHADAKLDLLIIKNGKKVGFEFKYTESPKKTKSMLIAQQDLKLDKLIVVYPGAEIFPLTETITAFGLEALKKDTVLSLF